MNATGRVGRLLGADPAVFTPFVRAYALIVRRRSRMKLTRGLSPRATGRISPFMVACFVSCLLGIAGVAVLFETRPALLGAVGALSFGAVIVVFSVLFDYLEVLASPDEYRVIAAHPHDEWSVLLAKFFVVGRALATIAACYFTPSIVAVGILYRSPLAAAAYAGGAALLTAAAALGATLVGVGIQARWGRAALLRFLPAIQTIFLVGYFSTFWGRRFIATTALFATKSLPAWASLIPTAWFAAPLEWAVGSAGPWTWLRGALAVGSVGSLLVVGAGWMRSGFGEPLLAMGGGGAAAAPRARPRTKSRARGGASARRRAPWLRDPAARAFLSMSRVHVRADIAVRSQLLVSFLMPAMMFLSPAISLSGRRQAMPEVALLLAAGAVGMMIVSFTTASTTSTRPEALWAVLVSPLDRARYTMALRGILRWCLVAPLVLLAGGWYLATAAGVPLHERLARVAGVAVYLDLLVTLQRGLEPDFPFSARPSRNRRMSWSQVLGMLIGFSIGGGGGFGLFLMWLIRGWGAWAAVAVLLGWRFLAEPWTRWRVRRAAASIEAL
ncbi:MAG TPA: hypothetical protein VFS09_00040 [Candidatus Eisenbacteria bacterium]|nr:hypothetical protein [Candidatus Eisenbacteria bacterium]